jgi:hypothetical protein
MTATSNVMRIASASHYFHQLGAEYPSIDARVNAVTRERYRRIDRFVQLTLLGAAECARGATLARDCGLYLSSGVGPITSNVLVQDAIHRDSRMPMPFSFVNTLGSSACYHVAKELELTGEAIMVARGETSFSAALACAHADLASAVSSQILIGAVEECVLPTERHRALLRRDESMNVAEGSHWLLLERADDSTSVARVEDFADATFNGYESRDAARITSYVSAHSDQQFGIRMSGADSWELLRFA